MSKALNAKQDFNGIIAAFVPTEFQQISCSLTNELTHDKNNLIFCLQKYQHMFYTVWVQFYSSP